MLNDTPHNFNHRSQPRVGILLLPALSVGVVMMVLLLNIAFVDAAHAQTETQQADPNACYGFAAPSPGKNFLVRIHRETGTVIEHIGSDPTVTDIEAMTFKPGGAHLYAADDKGSIGVLGTLSLADGKFSPISPPSGIGSGNGAQGSVTMDDPDGLSYDADERVIYAVLRRNNDKDLLFKIDPATGTIIKNAFKNAAGASVDYVVVTGSIYNDIDDIAIHPNTKELFGIANSSGSAGDLVIIDKQTGQVTSVVGSFKVADMEGLSFFNDGGLYASTGAGSGNNSGSLYRIAITIQGAQRVAEATKIGAFNTPGITDYEAIGCLTAAVAVSVEKEVNGFDADTPDLAMSIAVGDPVTWTYMVRNTGVVTLTNLALVDDKEGSIACPQTSLTPNAIITCVKTGTAQSGLYINQATVTGIPMTGPTTPVTDIDLAHYIGALPVGTLGDRIWYDDNGNGEQDGNEQGIANVKLVLLTQSSQTITETWSKDDGTYRFVNLAPATYLIKVDVATLPSNLEPTYDRDGTLDHLTSVTLQPNESRTDLDFGYRLLRGAISGRLWFDENNDTAQDNRTESGIPGVTIELTSANLVSNTVTNANGGYSFDNLVAGIYTIRVVTTTLPPKLEPTYDLDGSLDHQTTLMLAVGQGRNDVDFGYRSLTSSIGDLIWYDNNGNGAHDDGEKGISGVTLNLTDQHNVPRTSQSDPNGRYYFDTLPAGVYIVTVDTTTLPSGLEQTYDRDGLLDQRTLITLTANESRNDIDFGYRSLTSSIGDLVWYDVNASGVHDTGEDGIAGVTVDLIENNKIVSNTLTDLNGRYHFERLAAGVYTIRIVTPMLSGPITPTYDLDGVLDHTTTITLAANESLNDVDFGYRPLPGSIGGLLWNDANGNVLPDANEQGMGGVQLELLGGNGVRTRTTTDANGAYSFANLLPGVYTVTVDVATLPPNAKQTYDPDGILDNMTIVTLPPGVSRLDIDFGYQQTGPTPARLDLETFVNEQDADTPPGPTLTVDTVVTWSYRVANQGGLTLKNIAVTDDNGTPLLATDDFTVCNILELTPGNTLTCPATSVVQLGQFRSNSIATGQPVDNSGAAVGAPVTDSDLSHYFGEAGRAEIRLGQSRQPPGTCVQTPGVLSWSYTVTNSGTLALVDIKLTDTQIGAINCPFTTLMPGQVMICTANASTIAGQVDSTSTVTAQAVDSAGKPSGARVSSQAQSTYIGRRTIMAVEKLVNGFAADQPNDKWFLIPSTLTFTYVMTNSGELPIEGITVDDSDTSLAIACPGTTLGPGETMLCTATTPAVLGEYTSEGIFTGQPRDEQNNACGAQLRLTDPVFYHGYTPAITLTIQPLNAARDVGTAHSVTATIAFSNVPQSTANLPIHFLVDGLNHVSGIVKTDGAGQAKFTYFGSVNITTTRQTTATDEITAWLDLNGNQLLEPTGAAAEPFTSTLAIWKRIDVGICRDEGGTAEQPLRTITVKVANDGRDPKLDCTRPERPAVDVRVGMQVTDGTAFGPEFQEIGDAGVVTFTYITEAPRGAVLQASPALLHASDAVLTDAAPNPAQGDTDLITIWGEINRNDQRDRNEPFDLAEVTTAVQLVAFEPVVVGDAVILRWTTAVEIDNAGFNLYRANAEDGEYLKINERFIGAQGEGYGASYEFSDRPGATGHYYYKLETISNANIRTFYPAHTVWFEPQPAAELPHRLYLPLIQQ